MSKLLKSVDNVLCRFFEEVDVMTNPIKRKQYEEGSLIYDKKLRKYRKTTIKDLLK